MEEVVSRKTEKAAHPCEPMSQLSRVDLLVSLGKMLKTQGDYLQDKKAMKKEGTMKILIYDLF